jgi:hypothetical protein
VPRLGRTRVVSNPLSARKRQWVWAVRCHSGNTRDLLIESLWMDKAPIAVRRQSIFQSSLLPVCLSCKGRFPVYLFGKPSCSNRSLSCFVKIREGSFTPVAGLSWTVRIRLSPFYFLIDNATFLFVRPCCLIYCNADFPSNNPPASWGGVGVSR